MSMTKFATRPSIAGLVRLSALSCALFAGAPAYAQEPGLWDRMVNSVGLGGKQDAAIQPAAAPPQQAMPQPVQEPQEPGAWDKVVGAVGLGKNTEQSTIDYSERPKLNVPQQIQLPPPNPTPERQVAKRPGQEGALTKPPADYAEKLKGADGKVEGLREGDVAKEKKFLNFF